MRKNPTSLSFGATTSAKAIGYDVSIPGAVIGALWGFVDGYIAGFVIAWLYNKLAK
jgi:hypothetical protein